MALRLQVALLHLIAALHLVLGPAGLTRVAAASVCQSTPQEVASQMWNITQGYLSRYKGQCVNMTQAELVPMQKYFADAMELLADNTTTRVQFQIQLDSTCASGRITEAVELFNAEQADMYITLVPTPPFDSPSELSFTRPTLAVDGRWSDFAGGTLEDIRIYKDPRNIQMMPVLTYRRDILSQHSIPVPQTWQDLLQVAEQLQQLYNGTLEGVPFYPLCLNGNLQCGAPFLMIELVTSMTYLDKRVVNTVAFDPATMAPKGESAAMEEALRLYQALMKYNHPEAINRCVAHSHKFCKGACAITINSEQFIASQEDSCKGMQGKLGTSFVPGSSQVLSSEGVLVPCTADLCPHAVTKLGGSTDLVNFVPLRIPMLTQWIPNPASLAATSTALAAFASFMVQDYTPAQQAFDLSVHVTSPNTTQDLEFSKALILATAAAGLITPRIQQSDRVDASPFVQLGYDLTDTVSYLYVVAQVLKFENRYTGLPVPGASYIRLGLGEAASNATAPDANFTDIMANLNDHFRMVVTAFNNTALFRDLYHAGVGYVQPPANTTTSQQPAQTKQSAWHPGYTAGIVAALVLLAMAVAAILHARRQQQQGRTFTGRQLPPGLSPTTTLLVTDIQDSTGLWERLPADVMERTLAEHHKVLQSLLPDFQGYESGTEGDSFILAFYNPADALLYAAAVQKALLQAEWPVQLLQDEPLAVPSTICTQANHPDAKLSSVVRSLQQSKSACGQMVLSGNFRSSTAPCAGDDDAPCRSVGWLPCCVSTDASKCTADAKEQGAVGTEGNVDEKDNMTTGTGSEVYNSTEHGNNTSTRSKPEKDARGCSFGWALSQAWAEEENGEEWLGKAPAAASLKERSIIWRGLRVRMGLASGLSDPNSISINPATYRTQYGGSLLTTAKKVCDSGHGGQIVLSHSSFEQLGSSPASLKLLLMGDHLLTADQPSMCLYQAVVPGLEARLQSFPPLRSKQLVAEGVMAASVGTATVVFMNASSVQMLMNWNADVTHQSLSIYHAKVCKFCKKYGGYMPELVDGLALAIFPQPEDGIKWALAVQAALLSAPWPAELLENELCEPVMTCVALESEDGHITEVQKLAMRGLRVRVGIACGRVLDYLNPATARIMYRGRVMNWAARVAALASSSQVLCTEECWNKATNTPFSRLTGITAVNAGMHMLKGVYAPVHLFSCTYTHGYEAGTRSTCASNSCARRSSLIIGAHLGLAEALPAMIQSAEEAEVEVVCT